MGKIIGLRFPEDKKQEKPKNGGVMDAGKAEKKAAGSKRTGRSAE